MIRKLHHIIDYSNVTDFNSFVIRLRSCKVTGVQVHVLYELLL